MLSFLGSMATSLWSRMTGYTVAIGAALAILFAAYRKGGKDASARATETRLKELNKAREVEHEVDRLGDDAVHRDLRRWLRD